MANYGKGTNGIDGPLSGPLSNPNNQPFFLSIFSPNMLRLGMIDVLL